MHVESVDIILWMILFLIHYIVITDPKGIQPIHSNTS